MRTNEETKFIRYRLDLLFFQYLTNYNRGTPNRIADVASSDSVCHTVMVLPINLLAPNSV